MTTRSLAVWMTALILVAACGGATPTPAPTTAASPVASAAPSPAETPTTPPAPTPEPVKTATDLIASAGTTTTVPTLTYYGGLYQQGCATTWSKQPAAERAVDREISCLAVIGLLYARYAASHGLATPTYEAAVGVYNYAVREMPSAKPYFDAALLAIDAARAAPAPSPSGLKAITALAKVPARTIDYPKLHARVHDLFGRDLGTFLAACKGFNYPGTGIPACFPYPLYPAEAGGAYDRSPLAPDNTVGAIAACQYTPKVPAVLPNATEYDCGQAGVPFWISYVTTGDAAYLDLLGAIRDIYRSKGGGSYSSQMIIDNSGCFASWVLAPGTQPGCGD